MKNIGLAYTRSQINQLLADTSDSDNDNDNAYLIGLIFAKGDDFPNELEIRQVYFDPGNQTQSISFYSKQTPITKERLYREDQNSGKLEPSSYDNDNDKIEFTEDSDFGFAFFSREELSILISLSNRIIVFGGEINLGMMSFPDASIDSSTPPFATLIAEIDRHDMISIPINNTLSDLLSEEEDDGDDQETVIEELPTIAVGMPCPPYWDPAEKLMILSKKFRRKRANVVKTKEWWPRSIWIREIKKAWYKFTKDLEVEITRRCENHGKVRVHKVGKKKKVTSKSKRKIKKVEVYDK